MTTIKVIGNEITIDDKNSMASKLIAGCKGKIIIKSPYVKGGAREVTLVDKISEAEVAKPVVKVAEVKAEAPEAKPKAKKTTKKAK